VLAATRFVSPIYAPLVRRSRSLTHNKLCNIEDFESPELRPVIREVFKHRLDQVGPRYPKGYESRKDWEIAMAIRAFREFGILREDAEVLGVGAGTEATIFWLTGYVRRVFATDLYVSSEGWESTAPPTMLSNPGEHAPFPFEPRRLVVQHMDGRELMYEDESFDGIFSSGSIEHFGTEADVRRGVEEMCRVLKPAGIAALSTEFRLSGPPPGLPGILMFDATALREIVLAGLPWQPASPLDLRFSGRSRRKVIDFDDAVQDILAGRNEWSSYPHIVLRHGERVFTSVHLTLQKNG
jgi:SAM-dependent methyltransferase